MTFQEEEGEDITSEKEDEKEEEKEEKEKEEDDDEDGELLQSHLTITYLLVIIAIN